MTTLTVDNPYTLETACAVTLADDAAVATVLGRARAAREPSATSSVSDRIALCERAMVAMGADARVSRRTSRG